MDASFPQGLQSLAVTGATQYTVHIGSDILAEAGLLKEAMLGKQICIICAETIADTYLPPLLKALESKAQSVQIDIKRIPDEDTHKTLKTAESLWYFLAKRNHHRNTTLVALGGGVVNDLVGFVAACYLRGVAWVSCPTTLLAQTDAAIGGKTGVNLGLGKNLIGAFYEPKMVLCDLSTLKTLPDAIFNAGMAEVIKYALTFDADFFEWLDLHASDILAREMPSLLFIVARCVALKANVVEKDFGEKGLRRHLNFGHTLGHALETALQYKLSHGYAVSIGMMMAMHLSLRYGLEKTDLIKAEKLLEKFSLPTKIPNSIRPDEIENIMARDKKNDEKQRWILLTRLGHSIIQDDLTPTEIRQTMEKLMI